MTNGALNLPPEPDLSNCTRYPGLEAFDLHYKTIHAYLSLGICFFGIFTNTLNAVILTHNHMRSPTNLLLTSIAIADSVTMIAYVAKDVYLHFITSPDPITIPHGRGGIYFVLLTNFTAIGAHIFSTITTVMLAAFRCWVLYRPQCQVSYKHIKQTVAVAALLSFAMFVLGISTLVVGKLAPLIVPKNVTKDYYWFAVREGLDYVDRANFVIYGCFSKLASSLLIAFFTGLILAAMEKARRRYLKLKHGPSGPKKTLMSEQTMDTEGKDVGKRESRGNHRTTVMLVAVVVSFIITEAPQGVITTVVAIQDYCFLYAFYAPIGDLLDLLVLLNSSTNFILYCAMSAQFRKSFKELVMNEVFRRLCRQESTGSVGRRNAKRLAETVLVNEI
ncbi:fmrfamide receptor [Echinococcus multilocularis]|uniref:Neuropeptide receptor n=1 Tax=Echinococcus multilocularis TaxID=6211 RepID=A0A068Y740_ECHMU|nr:fmrfamide receptor [Echinococcus multilocularis]